MIEDMTISQHVTERQADLHSR